MTNYTLQSFPWDSKEITLESKVEKDSINEEISSMFDYTFEGISKEVIEIPVFPKEYKIGLIVGSSGSGKSTILKKMGVLQQIEWDNNKSVISHFKSAKEGSEKLGASGLNSIPSWMKPYSVLSTGEKFRADVARQLENNAIIDEFTSVVDRNVAMSASVAISKYIINNNLHNITFASCHYDIIDWLQPDWVYDTNQKKLLNRGSLQRPSIVLEIVACSSQAWSLFKKHHYLTADINAGADCYLAIWNNVPVAFYSVLAYPSGTLKNAWRGHRLVVLPDFQGMGIGTKFSEAIAQEYINIGKRFFAKTSNPRTGEHRNSSSLWRATSHNGKTRKDYNSDRVITTRRYDVKNKEIHSHRKCYTHEYVGL